MDDLRFCEKHPHTPDPPPNARYRMAYTGVSLSVVRLSGGLKPGFTSNTAHGSFCFLWAYTPQRTRRSGAQPRRATMMGVTVLVLNAGIAMFASPAAGLELVSIDRFYSSDSASFYVSVVFFYKRP